MKFDPVRVEAFARKAPTEELLDRVTVYRAELEPAAVELFEAELAGRGVTAGQITTHETARQQAVIGRPGGGVLRCRFCARPAVTRRRGWHKLLGLVPLFPREYGYCAEHAAE